MLIAVAVLFSVSYWLISKVEAAKWQQFIREQGERCARARRRHRARVRRVPRGLSRGRRDGAVLPGAVQRGRGNGLPIALGILVGFGALAVDLHAVLPVRRAHSAAPVLRHTSVLLYYMAFVFMGKGIRELQEGNVMTITVSRVPACRSARTVPERGDVARQTLLLALFVFALAKTFWPQRAVTLPTIEPAGPLAFELDERVEHLIQRVKELEARLARMEEEPELQATATEAVVSSGSTVVEPVREGRSPAELAGRSVEAFANRLRASQHQAAAVASYSGLRVNAWFARTNVLSHLHPHNA